MALWSICENPVDCDDTVLQHLQWPSQSKKKKKKVKKWTSLKGKLIFMLKNNKNVAEKIEAHEKGSWKINKQK